MDYQTWLKAFGVELSNQWNGINIDDLDPLHLQSLYHRGIGPSDAAHLHPVLKEITPAPKVVYNTGGRNHWTSYATIMAIVFMMGVLWQRHMVAMDQRPNVQLTPQAAATLQHGFGSVYQPEDVNYGVFDGYEPFSRHAMGYHPEIQAQPVSANELDEAASGDFLDYTYDNPGGGDPAGLGAQGIAVKATTRTSGPSAASSVGSQDSQTPLIEEFQATSDSKDSSGFTGQVTWQVLNADQVEILLVDQTLSITTNLQGNLPFTAVPTGGVFTIRATKGNRTVEQTATVGATATTGQSARIISF